VQIRDIINLIEKEKAENVLLLCHHNADPDAICSAFAFSSLLNRLKPNLKIEISAAQGPSKLSKHLLRNLPMNLVEDPNFDEADVIVLLDTNTVQQLNEWAERVKASKAPLIVIDHHASHPETEKLAALCIAEEKASSTCEIIYRFFKELKMKLTEKEAQALFLGIAFDTRHFVLANSYTFKAVAELLDQGVNAEKSLSMLSLPMDLSERVARLKASRRMKIMKINDWIVALTHVSSYQASAARALIGLGAHVAIVAGEQGESLRISLRATKDFYEKTGIHLGKDVAKPLGEYFHGMGGGHTVAAGVNGIGDAEMALKKCWKLLRIKIKSTQN
jgi:nanoRNase/pAp phosphatase (c-di-AMP/oligoRNAs hydrolase)